MSAIRISKTLGKFLAWAIILVLLLLLVALGTFRFAPHSYLSLINSNTSYQVTAGDLNTQLLPLSFTFSDLSVSFSPSSGDSLPLLQSQRLIANIDWLAALSNKHAFWYGELKNSEIFINNFQRVSAQTAKQSQANTNVKTPSPITPHFWLSWLNLTVSDTTLVIDEQTRVELNTFETHLENKDAQQANNIKQTVDIDIRYGVQNQQLNLSGQLTSHFQDGVSRLGFKLDELDLNSILPSIDSSTNGHKQTQTVPAETDEDLDTLDWSWLSKITPTQVAVDIKKIMWGENTLTNPSLHVMLDNSIRLERLTSLVDWTLDSDLVFKDELAIVGELSLTNDNQLNTELSMTLTESEWQLQGQLHPLQLLDSKLNLSFDAKNFPLFNQSGGQSLLVQQNIQWLPIAAQLSVQPKNQQNRSEKNTSLQLEMLDVRMGESEFKGHMLLQSVAAQPLAVTLKLNAEQVVYTSVKNDQVQPEIEPKAEVLPQTKQRLFSKQTIDWSWMDKVVLDADIAINTLKADQLSLKNIRLPVSLDSRDGLRVRGFNANIGDKGNIKSHVHITPSTADQVALSLNIEADNVLLDDLSLLDPDSLSGGETQLNLDLSARGNNLAQIAAGLNGAVLLEVNQATIGNDAFEIIGSDLFSELVGKLNPFLKSDPTTTLKCAVIHLPIQQGKVDVDKSIAIETSKMVLVADGSIDLDTEKVSLRLTPQSRQGVGIDIGSIVKFIQIGGTLSHPKPVVGAKGLLKSGIAVGAALSTGGTSILADSLISKIGAGNPCERARGNT